MAIYLLFLLFSALSARKLYVHQGERLEYDISKGYFYDDYEVAAVSGSIERYVSIVPKVECRDGPSIHPYNPNANSSSIFYNLATGISHVPVSYTHLTLPTICSV
eukprot:TRINITY_DN16446_c0_g1_i1.p2 TRINITY_DN16446_c0_g1~~TRINITY_DN16446_c0_g1_i1.p2  ORF type:complete len:105 (+),score=25.60 TRINITY_DN16446_c0_g1_i1:62-376(+)